MNRPSGDQVIGLGLWTCASMTIAWRPSASATITSPHSCQFGLEFGSGRRLNAILVPSRENAGKPSIRGSSVSWTRPEPSGLAVQRSPSAMNATEPGAASPKGGGNRRCDQRAIATAKDHAQPAR